MPEDTDAFMQDFLSTIAGEQGVEASDVSVESLDIIITVGYSFPDSVDVDDVRVAVAAAVGLPIEQVIIVSSGGGRRLAEHTAQLIAHNFSTAAAVYNSSTDATKLAEALRQIDPEAAAPTVTAAPMLEVKVSVSIAPTPAPAPDPTQGPTDVSAAMVRLSQRCSGVLLLSMVAMSTTSVLP